MHPINDLFGLKMNVNPPLAGPNFEMRLVSLRGALAYLFFARLLSPLLSPKRHPRPFLPVPSCSSRVQNLSCQYFPETKLKCRCSGIQHLSVRTAVSTP